MNGGSTITRDRFTDGTFWELYTDLEFQFQGFLKAVPFTKRNEKTHSFRLLNLILSIGGYIDSAFKEMTRYPDFSRNTNCKEILKILKESQKRVKLGKNPFTVSIELPLKAFDSIYRLSNRKVVFKYLPERVEVVPFTPHNPKTKAPKWWEIYNGLKHDVGKNIENANLKNTRDALAGAFLLNVIHIPAALRLFRYGVTKTDYTGRGIGVIAVDTGLGETGLQQILKKQRKYPLFVETSVFKYDYGQ